MFYMLIKVGCFKFSNPTQFYKCQYFDHLNFYFRYSSYYVKYAEQHLAKDYQKFLETIRKCTNCQGGHTMIYKKCPALLKLKNDRHSQRLQIP